MPAMKVCTRCPAIIPRGQSMCDQCRRDTDTQRGDATQRGYGHAHRTQFREAVLARDPVCKLCLRQLATVADHWPNSRRELVEQGLDPNDPAHGRGLCKRCHDQETARNQPGGWNDRKGWG